jgi:hypothetical protein
MSAPKRIQRRRTKGWRMPEGTIYVGRPTRWGNIWRVGRDGTAQECRDWFETWAEEHALEFPAELASLRKQLGGRDLACWCPLDQPCHADVLLELANRSGISLPVCPDCHAGKHRNCDGVTWDNEADDFAQCPCTDLAHIEVRDLANPS